MKHSNVAMFVPHNGCPNKCVFCNQTKITGAVTQPTAQDVEFTIKKAMQNLGENAKNAQIAFFGGSFTAIDEKYMVELLKTAYKFVENGPFSGIRVSTRPDCIDLHVLDILKMYGVNAIELGAQSMDDKVLIQNKRGHTSDDVKRASKMIKSQGISLGLQMMTGLYKSSAKTDYHTAREIAKLSPDTVRIYPTVVMKDTELEDLYNCGLHVPPSVGETVDLCKRLIVLFERDKGIKIIRIGLHAGEDLCKNMVAGPFHPAFSQLCRSKLLFEDTIKILPKKPKSAVVVKINPDEFSNFVGIKKHNLKKFYSLGYNITVWQDKSVEKGKVMIEN